MYIYMFHKPHHIRNNRSASHNFNPMRSKLEIRRYIPSVNCICIHNFCELIINNFLNTS